MLIHSRRLAIAHFVLGVGAVFIFLSRPGIYEPSPRGITRFAEYTLGDAKASQQALDQLIAAGAGDSAYEIADVYAWRGEKDQAFEWLERAYRQQDGGIESTKIDPQFASLRSDPRYTALLRKLNFPP